MPLRSAPLAGASPFQGGVLTAPPRHGLCRHPGLPLYSSRLLEPLRSPLSYFPRVGERQFPWLGPKNPVGESQSYFFLVVAVTLYPHIWWLTTTEIYSLTALEARRAKSVSRGQNQVGRAMSPSGSRGASLFLTAFSSRGAARTAGLTATSLRPLPLWSQGLLLACE